MVPRARAQSVLGRLNAPQRSSIFAMVGQSNKALCIIDGSKGLYAALTKALAGYVVIQHCQWHKQENGLFYLPKNKQDEIKACAVMILYGKALQHAYDLPTYKEAKAELDAIKPELALMNESALSSLEVRNRRNTQLPSPRTDAQVEAVLPYDELH